jgi:hypothetical protein
MKLGNEFAIDVQRQLSNEFAICNSSRAIILTDFNGS